MVSEQGGRNLLGVVDPTGSLTASVDLTQGGAIRSVRTSAGVELFAAGHPASSSSVGTSFLASGLEGYVDCLPTIDGGQVAGAPSTSPLVDHGAVWSVPWTVSDLGADASESWLTATVEVADWPLTLARTVRVTADAVRLDYVLENRGSEPLPVLWAGHGLLRTPANSWVTCAPLQHVRVSATSADWPSEAASRVLDELSASGVLPLDMIPIGQWAKAYAAWPANGLWLVRPDLFVHVQWLEQSTPRWLGLWVNNYGYPTGAPLQHVALEPTNGGKDSLARCVDEGSAWMADGRSTNRWSVQYALHPPQGHIHPLATDDMGTTMNLPSRHENSRALSVNLV